MKRTQPRRRNTISSSLTLNQILQEAQVSFSKALPWAKKPGLLLVTVNVIMLTVKRSGVEKTWLPSFSMAAVMSTTGPLMLNSVFPFENESRWGSEVQNKIPAGLNFNPSLYEDISIDVSVSHAHISKKGHQSRNPLHGLFSQVTISYSILDNREFWDQKLS